jgi:hypothetical protein
MHPNAYGLACGDVTQRDTTFYKKDILSGNVLFAWTFREQNNQSGLLRTRVIGVHFAKLFLTVPII